MSYDLVNVFLDGIAAGKTTRADLLAYITAYNKKGEATGVTYKWDAKGELDPSQVVVWAYKADDGAWAPRPGDPEELTVLALIQ